MSPSPWVVVGLGNPGTNYANNRHNVGQMVLDELAHRTDARFRQHKAHALVGEGRLSAAGPRIIMAKPNSFMNRSGASVASTLAYYSIGSERLIVIHDELDVPFDTIKLKKGGGHGGHNGLRDIISALGTADFIRVRVGIGRPPGRQDPSDYVLHDFSSEQQKLLTHLTSDAADAVELVVLDGLAEAQQRIHSSNV